MFLPEDLSDPEDLSEPEDLPEPELELPLSESKSWSMSVS